MLMCRQRHDLQSRQSLRLLFLRANPWSQSDETTRWQDGGEHQASLAVGTPRLITMGADRSTA